LGQAIKWQHHQGLLSPEIPFDLFKGSPLTLNSDVDHPCVSSLASIEFSKSQRVESIAFSPDGLYFATGTVNGFVEIWNYMTGKLRKDLDFQAKEKFMMMETGLLSLSFSPCSQFLVGYDFKFLFFHSGAKDGKIRVWKLPMGQLYRKFANAHTQGITCVRFNQDASHVLSCSFDSTLRYRILLYSSF
jgi:WD40 repeat-containing protein SMU1